MPPRCSVYLCWHINEIVSILLRSRRSLVEMPNHSLLVDNDRFMPMVLSSEMFSSS